MLIKAQPDVKFRIIRKMISRDNNLLNISWLCAIAGVSRSGYYRWLAAEDSRKARQEQDKEDFVPFWRLITIEDTPRAHAESTCSCCIGSLPWL